LADAAAERWRWPTWPNAAAPRSRSSSPKRRRTASIDRLREDLRLQNALEFLKENAVIEDVEPAEDKHGCAFEEGKAA